MPERAAVNQVVQVGVEATPGTAVAATKRLASISIEPAVQADTSMFRPQGTKFATVQALNKEWTEADVSGQPSYNELQYLLASLLGNPAVAQVMDASTATGVYEYTFSPSSTDDDAPKTLTIEQGSSVRAHKSAYNILTDLGFTFSRSEVSLDGTFLGQALTDAATLTAAGVSTPALVPILPSQINVYLDTTSAGLGTTRMTRVLSVEPSIGGKYGPTWFLDATKASFTNHVDLAPDATVDVLVEADAEGMALLARLRDGATRFLRVEAVGPTHYTNGPFTAGYRLWLDLAIKISDVDDFSDEDGIYSVGFTGTVVHDATWGRALQVRLRNTLTAL